MGDVAPQAWVAAGTGADRLDPQEEVLHDTFARCARCFEALTDVS
ncbi:hypothetical protein SIN09_12340 [Streptomyces sp. F8]|nr:hypothetical protein [Streptomyces sp. F8]MDX6760207.1 hypothetical protein [Streptomyces sp. F8]